MHIEPIARPATADLCDANLNAQVIPADYRSFGGRDSCIGPVEIVSTWDDNSLVRKLVNNAGEGRVLLVDNHGSPTCAMLGGNLAEAAAKNGWRGIIVHGAVRDVLELSQTPIAIFALMSCPRKSMKHGTGSHGVPVRICSTYIRPGDVIAADADGVIVLPSGKV